MTKRKRVVKAETFDGLDIYIDPDKPRTKEVYRRSEVEDGEILRSKVTPASIAGIKKMKLGEED